MEQTKKQKFSKTRDLTQGLNEPPDLPPMPQDAGDAMQAVVIAQQPASRRSTRTKRPAVGAEAEASPTVGAKRAKKRQKTNGSRDSNDSGGDATDAQEVERMSVAQLKQRLKQHGLVHSGSKLVLQERFLHHLSLITNLTPPNPTTTSPPNNHLTSHQHQHQQPQPPPVAPEKRAARYTTTASFPTAQRIQRAMTQRLYLVHQVDTSTPPTAISDASAAGSVGAGAGAGAVSGNASALGAGMRSRLYHVLGSTGNVYKIAIGRVPSCDCPDAARGNLCKHVLFIMLKVLKVDPNSPLVFQK
jgi:hypothetical protein